MRLVISQFMSLDGVVRAPGGPEEDADGDFAHGGWSIPYLHWNDSTLLSGNDAAAAVTQPKHQHDGEKRPLELVGTTTTGGGALCCVYRPGESPPIADGEG